MRSSRLFKFGATVAVALALVLTGTFLLPTGVRASRPNPGASAAFQPGVVLVGVSANTSDAEVDQIANNEGANVSTSLQPIHLYALRVAPGTELAKAAALKRYGNVRYAQPNYVVKAHLTPNDALFSQQWDMPKIGAPTAWTTYPGTFAGQGASGTGSLVAIADTGIDSTHEDLSDGRVLTSRGVDCTSGTCVADTGMDLYGHGTHVAGTVAANTNNGIGVTGVSYTSRLLPIRVLDASGSGSDLSVAAGILYASQQKAAVVNLSLGGTGPFPTTECDAVTSAVNSGTVVVASAGNNANNVLSYPASCPGAISVTATDSADGFASFSTWGTRVFAAAPGVDILSTLSKDPSLTLYDPSGYGLLSGTSMAAPHMTGLVGLLRGRNPSLTVQQIKVLIAQNADKVGPYAYGADPNALCSCTWNDHYGYGRINVARTVAAAGPGTPDFSLSASPSSLSLTTGASGTFNVSVSPTGGFSGTVSLSQSSTPAGLTVTPASASSASPYSPVTFTASSSTAGTYTVTVTGTSGTLTRTTTVTVTVSAPAARDFSISASPSSISAPPSVTATSTISLAALNGWTGNVSLTLSTPAGVSASISPTSAAVPGSATLTVSSATAGTYSITVTASGTSGGVSRTHSVVVTFTVTADDCNNC